MSKARDLANASTALSAVSATELGYVDGVTSAIQTQLDAKAASSTPTLTSPIVVSPEERTTVSATAADTTVNFDASTQGILYYTSNATANWTLNVRGTSSVALNSILAVGDAITVSFLVTNGSTAYYQTAFNIDGSAVTPKYSGGTAPASGNASSIDVYTYTIIKTAATPTYTVFGAGPIKYAQGDIVPLFSPVSAGGIGKATVTATTGSPSVDTSSRAGKTIYNFTGSGSITIGTAGTVEILVIGGGGAGGLNGKMGGGGAGGYVYNTSAFLPAETLTVTIGAGGSSGSEGGNIGPLSGFASFIGSSGVGYVALGGGAASGGGGSTQRPARPGGSGGGGGEGQGTTTTGASFEITGQGNSGGNFFADGDGFGGGGGGGGANAGGGNATTSGAGAGGAGKSNSITGSSVTYAGGGGGGSNATGVLARPGGSGGAGGGGNGNGSGTSVTSGTANTGGGGGAGGTDGTIGLGGSGLVIVVIG